VPGGFSNTAQGDYSFAAGRDAKALDAGSFVWADSTTVGGFGVNFASTAANEFSVRATGGARFVSGVDGTGNPNAGVQLAPGGGSWSSLSDRAAKRAIKPVSGKRVLRTLDSVPVATWSYRAQDPGIRHIGPMAQDFYKAFRVGEDRKHIDSVDADGVALAAIKGLSRKVERLQHKVASLEKREP
jgi:endosialidase-like protein